MKDAYVTFSFERVEFLGIMGNYYYIIGNFCSLDDDSNYEKCIIKIKKSIYHRNFKIWVKEKQWYCEKLNCFCGINFTYSVGPIKISNGSIYNSDTKKDEECKVVYVSDLEVEVEHG